MKNSFLHIGLLILRIGIGTMFIIHGFPKIAGGAEKWQMLGMSMSHIGIDFYPQLWGFAAAFAEFVGGILLVFGLFARVASFLLFSTMLVATIHHLSQGDSFLVYSHALEAAILFFSLTFIGAGDYSFDARFFGRSY